MVNIKCGVPQGSILYINSNIDPNISILIYLIYINDLFLSTSFLDPVMFVEDPSLFYSHQDTKELFRVVNSVLEKVCDWFNANKLSLSEKKTMFFHRHANRNGIPLKLPQLCVNKKEINRASSIKFPGVTFDENLNWN